VVPRKTPWVLWGALIAATALAAMALGRVILPSRTNLLS
jgi:hypothetical protein